MIYMKNAHNHNGDYDLHVFYAQVPNFTSSSYRTCTTDEKKNIVAFVVITPLFTSI